MPDDLDIDAYSYDLPQDLIAQTPAEPRDHSRLMVFHRRERRQEHRRFTDLPNYLRPGDVLVFNDSRVFPARVYGARQDTGAKIELLLLRRDSPGVWQALVRPGRRMGPGAAFTLGAGPAAVDGEVIRVLDDGSRLVRLSSEERLDEIGVVPLPPYIHQRLADPERYQTIYSRITGSVAAPTAGLHVTPQLLEAVQALGAQTAFVTLHVGWASFRPVQTNDITQHEMHSEFFTLTQEAADTINRAKRSGRRIFAVGTTTVRLLEHAAQRRQDDTPQSANPLEPASGWADIFIYPGYEFRIIDGLVTNFHLPRSTLLMLVSAFAGREATLDAYREAVQRRYRFYSFGDAMLIL